MWTANSHENRIPITAATIIIMMRLKELYLYTRQINAI